MNKKNFLLSSSLSRIVYIQFKEYFVYYFLAFLSLVGTHFTQSYMPLFAKNLGDLALAHKLDQAPIKLYILLALSVLIFRTSSRLLFFYPARVLQKNMRIELIQRFENSRPKEYSSIDQGDIFQNIQNDVDQLRGFIGFALLQLANAVICLSILVPKLYEFNGYLVLGIMPLFVCLIFFIIIILNNKKYYKQSVDSQAKLQNILIESYHAKQTIKSFLAHEKMIDYFQKVSSDELNTFIKGGKGNAVAIPLMNLGIGLSLVFGAYIIWKNNLSPSTLIYFSGVVFLINEPLSFFSWIGAIYSNAKASIERIHKTIKILDKKTLIHELSIIENDFQLSIPFWGKKRKYLMRKNCKYAIVGPTGVGKTTLLEEIAYTLKSHNIKVSYVPQSPHIFNDTIESNIFLGETPTQERIQLANDLLEIFGLQQYPLSLEVGENGKKLSGGQQKRVALIRSILSNADVILWDDPFASIDVIQEKIIMQKLDLSHCTLIFSTHRWTTFQLADWYYFLNKDTKSEVLSKACACSTVVQEKGECYHFFQKQFA